MDYADVGRAEHAKVSTAQQGAAQRSTGLARCGLFA